MIANDPISYTMSLQSQIAQSTIIDWELVAAALNMKEVVFCANMVVNRV